MTMVYGEDAARDVAAGVGAADVAGLRHPSKRPRALIVVTRAPEPGMTKTRMMPDLSPEQCAELHEAILFDLGEMRNQLPPDVDVFVAYAPEGACERIRSAFRADAEYLPQCGGALGDRMAHAGRSVLSRGYERCVMIGADAPEVLAEDVVRAFDLLGQGDAVIGPSDDGGFYLVGFSAVHDELFSLSAYGHERVCEQTVAALRAAGREVLMMREVADIDCWDDAAALLERADIDGRVAKLRCVGYLRQVAR